MHIPNPCHENWSAMTPAQQGRHCIQCNTAVMDMTRLSNEEILKLFNEGKARCGRFYEDQLQPPTPQKGWLRQSFGQFKKEWLTASLLLMLQLNISLEAEAKTPSVEQVVLQPEWSPIDSGVALPGYIQGRKSTTDGRVLTLDQIFLRSASGKTIDSTRTDSSGHFAFSVANRNPEEKYYVVSERSKHKTRFRVYVWHKTKVECQSGDWVDVKVKRVKRKRLNRLFKRSVIGCPKFH